MKKYLLAIVVLCLTINGCHSFKKELSVPENINNLDYAIHVSINDFSNLKRLHKSDSVFSVTFEELPKNNSLIVINIISKTTNLLVTKDVTVGSRGKIASKYIEKNGSLYYWWDDEYPLTQEALSMFGKYRLLQDDKGGTIQLPDGETDDAKKGASYYFCKDNPTKFKRVITNIAVGYYNPPVLDCDSLK